MILTLLTPALLPALLQESAADPARARYDALAAQWRKPAAVEVKIELVAITPGEDGEEGSVERSTLEYRIARPLHGTVKMTSEEQGTFELVADGEHLYFLNHEEKQYMEIGQDWSAAFLEFIHPLHVWADAELSAPEGIEWLPADAARGAASGYQFAVEEQGAHTVWLDAAGRPLAMHIEMPGGDGRIELKVAQWNAHDSVDLAQWTGKLPEGYETFAFEQPDFDASLLAVGVEAPNVTMTDMGGQAVTMADLKGKTVLLNFWFRH